MESAEVLFRKLTVASSEVGVARIKADRAAVALSVLQEFEVITARWGLDGHRDLGDAYHRSMDELRAKYTQPPQQSQESSG